MKHGSRSLEVCPFQAMVMCSLRNIWETWNPGETGHSENKHLNIQGPGNTQGPEIHGDLGIHKDLGCKGT